MASSTSHFTSSSSTTQSFPLPEMYGFPPLFTLQPVAATREKQLKIWRDIVVAYHIHNSLHHMVPETFPLFCNESIGRRLNKEGIDAVVQSLIQHGNAEWTDATHTSLHVIWKSVEVISGEVLEWARKNDDGSGTVYTIYELHSGDQDDHLFNTLHGTDPIMLRRALELLEKNRKCKIIPGAAPDEDGVKFSKV